MTRSLVVVFGYFTSELNGRPPLYVGETLITRRFGDWEHVCWGSKGFMGRFPSAIRLAWLKQAKIVWLMGSARYESGEKEGEWMFREVLRRVVRLHKEFPTQFRSVDASPETLTQWLEDNSIVHADGFNTMQSLEHSIPLLNEFAGKDDLFIDVMTSENHAPRVRRDISALKHGNIIVTGGTFRRSAHALQPNINFFVGDCETGYGGGEMVDVVVQDLNPDKITSWVK